MNYSVFFSLILLVVLTCGIQATEIDALQEKETVDVPPTIKDSLLKALAWDNSKKPNLIAPSKTIDDIVKNLEIFKSDLNAFIEKIKSGVADKKVLHDELENIRKNLRKSLFDYDKLQTIEDFKDKHLQLRSRLVPIKRAITHDKSSETSESEDSKEIPTTSTSTSTTTTSTPSIPAPNPQNKEPTKELPRVSKIIVQPKELIEN